MTRSVVNSDFTNFSTLSTLFKTFTCFFLDAEEEETKDEAMAIFYLELLVRVTIQNKDRVEDIWPSIADHMTKLIGISAENADKKPFLLERAVNGLLRMTVRLARKEELASLVVQSLSILQTLDTNAVFLVARHVAFGLYELLRNNANNIHETEDWSIIFSLIEMVGAGITKESEPTEPSESIRERSGSVGSSSGGWIVLDKTSENAENESSKRTYFNPNAIIHPKQIVLHDSRAYLKCCDSLSFLVRDVAHITPHNFGQCVQTLKIFVEASFVGRVASSSSSGGEHGDENKATKKPDKLELRTAKKTPFNKSNRTSLRKVRSAPHNVRNGSGTSGNSGANSDYDENDSDNEDLSSEFHHVSLQLLDLMHTLHTRAAQIYFSWAEEEEQDKWESNPSHNLANTSRLWTSAWCPLLQGTLLLVLFQPYQMSGVHWFAPALKTPLEVIGLVKSLSKHLKSQGM